MKPRNNFLAILRRAVEVSIRNLPGVEIGPQQCKERRELGKHHGFVPGIADLGQRLNLALAQRVHVVAVNNTAERAPWASPPREDASPSREGSSDGASCRSKAIARARARLWAESTRPVGARGSRRRTLNPSPLATTTACLVACCV